MAFCPGLYNSRLYVPDLYENTWIPRHFPVHHYPFEHTRHIIDHGLSKVGHELSQMGHDFFDGVSGHSMRSPCIDTQESKRAFYIDVELPGLESEDNMKLRWISSRTLLLKASLRRKGTAEDEVVLKEGYVQSANNDAAVAAQTHEVDNKDQVKSAEEQKEPAVYLTLGERHLGLNVRAFNFPVDVDHEKTKANLKAGILRITVPKTDEVQKVDRTISVENHG